MAPFSPSFTPRLKAIPGFLTAKNGCSTDSAKNFQPKRKSAVFAHHSTNIFTKSSWQHVSYSNINYVGISILTNISCCSNFFYVKLLLWIVSLNFYMETHNIQYPTLVMMYKSFSIIVAWSFCGLLPQWARSFQHDNVPYMR